MPTTYISTACRIGDHHDCQDHPVVLCACVCHDDERRESVRIPLRPLNRDEFAEP